jgi:hypothetical protein
MVTQSLFSQPIPVAAPSDISFRVCVYASLTLLNLASGPARQVFDPRSGDWNPIARDLFKVAPGPTQLPPRM